MKSGVLNVYHRTDSPKRAKWVYIDGEVRVSDFNLFSLECKIKELNLPWIVVQDSSYETIISSELSESENFSLMDDCIYLNIPFSFFHKVALQQFLFITF